MLAWLGVLGKLVEFSITKIADKQIDLAFDQRKRAAKAFLSLHESLEKLEQASIEFIRQSHDGSFSGNQRVLYRVPIEKIAEDIDSASVAFFKAFEDLRQIIYLYDEDLYKLLWGINLGKRRILSLLANLSAFQGKKSFRIFSSDNPQTIFTVRYSAPSSKLLDANLENLYENLKRLDVPDNESFDRHTCSRLYESVNWPKELVSSLLVQNPNLSYQFSDHDQAKIAVFTELLEEQIKLLASARRSLAMFIKGNFSFDDLLNFSTFNGRY